MHISLSWFYFKIGFLLALVKLIKSNEQFFIAARLLYSCNYIGIDKKDCKKAIFCLTGKICRDILSRKNKCLCNYIKRSGKNVGNAEQRKSTWNVP